MAARARRAPRAVLVLGMHRSGTSLATALLADIGAALSDDLVEPNEFNEKGYFESLSVMQLHDDILRALGSSWRMPMPAHGFGERWWESEAIAPYRAALVRLVRRNTRDERMWAVKDPRASRLLPLWNAVFDELGLDARYVLSFRAPARVAASLERRDGMPRAVADALWLEHNAHALLHGKERIACVLDYEAWFDRGAAQIRDLAGALALSVPPQEDAAALAARRADPKLRHQLEEALSPYQPVDRLYAQLRAGDLRAAASEAERWAQERRESAMLEDAVRFERDRIALSASTLHAIHQRLAWRRDVSDEEVRPFLEAQDDAARAVAHMARSRTAIRRALESIAQAARAQHYANPQTVEAAVRIAPLADVDTPYIGLLRDVGLRAAERGDAEQAFQLLGDALRRAFVTGERPAPAARSALCYLTDPEIDRALGTLARGLYSPQRSASSSGNAVALVCTLLRRGAPGAADAIELARALQASGFGVRVVATEPVPSAESYARELAGAGIAGWQPQSLRGPAAVRAVLEYFDAHPVDAAIFMPYVQDAVARAIAGAGIAAIRIPRPAEAVAVALPAEVDDAPPLDRAAIGVPEDAVLLANVGRYAKVAQPEFLEGVARALAACPNAYFVLCGADAGGEYDLVLAYAAGHEVSGRVRQVPQAAWASLVKSAGVYCDTAPFNGRRALLCAMHAGVPVAAFRAGAEDGFAQAAIGEAAPIANDALEYGEIVARYVRDADLRAEVGGGLRERCAREFGAVSAGARLKSLLESAGCRPAAEASRT